LIGDHRNLQEEAHRLIAAADRQLDDVCERLTAG
jgi:hypothetical protein